MLMFTYKLNSEGKTKMTGPEQSHEQLATSQQAQDLLKEVGTLTTIQGKNYGDRNTFGTNVSEMPEEVAAHLPEPRSDSSESEDSVYIGQIFDRETGQPRREGMVGIVTFTRKEKVDKDLMYAAHTNYHITTKDGGATYGLERHVTNTEHGPHKAREMYQKLGRSMVDPASAAQDMLKEITSLRDRIDTTRPLEQAMGLFDVTQEEAQQVIDFTKGLNGEA